MYVYMETVEKTPVDGGGVVAKPSGYFNCRGAMEKNSDPKGFARMMGKRGLRVAVMDSILNGEKGPGKRIPAKELEAGVIDFKEAMMERIMEKRERAMAEAISGGAKKTDA